MPTVYEADNSSTVKYSANISGVNYQIPTPGNIVAGGGSDKPLILLNSSSQQEFRFWQANINSANRTITYSGAGVFYYNNDGGLHNGQRSLSVPFAGAGTGSGLSYLAGLVTNEDYNSGAIKHAIRFANSCSNSTATFRPPAVKTDQPHPSCSSSNPSSPSSIEMGSILQLDKSIDCNSRTVPTKPSGSKETQILRMVCKAMQDYGVIMLDGTGAGGGANFYMEDNQTAGWNLDDKGKGNYGWIFRPPYYSSDGISRNGSSDGIPLDKMRVLKRPASSISWGDGTPVTSGSSTPTNSGSSPSPASSPTKTPSSSTNSVANTPTTNGNNPAQQTQTNNSNADQNLPTNNDQNSQPTDNQIVGLIKDNPILEKPIEKTQESIKSNSTPIKILSLYFSLQVLAVLVKYIFF